MSEHQVCWSAIQGNTNSRLKGIRKAQSQSSKRSKVHWKCYKAGSAEEAYSTVNPVILQWLIRIRLGNPSLPSCKHPSPPPSCHTPEVGFCSFCWYHCCFHLFGAAEVFKTEFGITLKQQRNRYFHIVASRVCARILKIKFTPPIFFLGKVSENYTEK